MFWAIILPTFGVQVETFEKSKYRWVPIKPIRENIQGTQRPTQPELILFASGSRTCRVWGLVSGLGFWMVCTLVNVKNTRISTFTVRGLWGGRVSGFQDCRASAMQKVSRPLAWIPFCRKISADEGVLAREVLKIEGTCPKL